MRNVNIFWVLALFCASHLTAQNVENYTIDSPNSVCLTPAQTARIQQEIQRSLRQLPAIPHLRNTEKLIRPIRQADGFEYKDIFALAAHVDHDPRKPGHLLDYNCGSFTADGTSHNHHGTDYMLWPFGWRQMDQNQAEVIAAASGQIVAKVDGNYDRNCPYRFGSSAGNSIYIQHADGTIAWYLNLKSGSLTDKDVGEMVQQGEYLAAVGSSGNSFYPHLHFELRDEEGQVIDPYAGPCNPGESLWADQPEYLASGVNYLTVYTERPDFNNFCDPADQYEQDQYEPGESLFFLAFIRQQRKGQEARMRIIYPDGTALTDRSTELSRSNARSYFVHAAQLPDDAPGGVYTCILNYNDEEHSTTFEVLGNNSCPAPEQSEMVSQVFGPNEVQLTYRAKTYSAYQWQVRRAGEPEWINLPTEAYSIYVRGLRSDSKYEFRVRYWCETGWSAWSGIATFATPYEEACDEVSLADVHVTTPDPATAQIAIDLPDRAAYDWRVRKPGDGWSNVTSTPDSIYTFHSLTAETTYEFQVRVRCGNIWSGWSDIGSFTTPAPQTECDPPLADDILVSALSSTEVQLTSPDNDKERYDWRIRRLGNSSWISLPSTESFSVVLRGLSPDITYEIQHRWICDEAWSEWSAAFQYTSPGANCPAPAPGDIAVEYESPTKTTILINSLVASAYQVRYRETGLPEWTDSDVSASPSITINTNGGSAYEFQVRVFCNEEWSAWTSTNNFTTPETNPCPAPTLAQTNVALLSSFSVEITVSDAGNTTIELRYRQSGSTQWTSLTPSNVSAFLLENLLDNTLYEFQLRTICGNVPGSWSETGIFTTPELNECPEVDPNNITVINVSETIVQLLAPFFPGLRYQWRYRLSTNADWTTLPATTASSLVLEGLLPGTDYEVQLRILCSFGNGAWSETASFTTSGQIPCDPIDANDILISGVTPTSASVDLSAPPADDGYRLRYRTVNASSWETLEQAQPPFTLDNLDPESTYEIQMARLCDDVWSEWSNSQSFQTPALPTCDRPASGNIAAGDITRTRIQLSYQPDSASRYQWRYRQSGTTTWTFLERGFDPSYLLTGLTAGTQYDVQIRQECNNGLWSSWSATAQVETAPPYSCAKPSLTDTEVSQLGPYQATLAYNGPEREAYQWRIRESGNNEWTVSSGTTVPNRVFGNLIPSTTYQYQLRVDCGEGYSAWSNSGLFTTPAEFTCDPPSLSDITVMVVDHQSVQLEVTNGEFDSYQFRYRQIGQGSWTTLPVQAESQVDIDGLDPESTYEFSVRVLCGDLWSDWSNSKFATTPEEPLICGRPSLNQINVYLLPNVRSVRLFIDVPDANAYEWRYKRLGVDNWEETGQETNTTWLFEELRGETTYEYQVRVLCGDTWSAWSMTGTFTTAVHLYCDDPTLDQVEAANIGRNRADIVITIPDAEGFQVQHRALGQSLWIDGPETSSPTTTLTGLSAQTTYQYRFRFLCSSGWSDWSLMEAFTTLAPEAPDPCEDPSFTLEVVDDFTVRLLASEGAELYEWRYRDISTIFYIESGPIANRELVVPNLNPEVTYRFQVRVQCDGVWSDWSDAQYYTTPQEPPCATPAASTISALVLTDSEVMLESSDDSKLQYDWRFRPQGTTTWVDLTASQSTDKRVSGLQPGVSYQVQLRILCDNGWSDWSASVTFTMSETILEPNLTCADLPSLVMRDEMLTVNGPLVLNNGSGDAGSYALVFYLSENGQPGGASLHIDTLQMGTLASGAAASVNRNFDISGMDLADANYKLGFVIDYSNQVQEVNEADNICWWNTPEIKPTPADTCYAPTGASAQPGLSHVYMRWGLPEGSSPTEYQVRFRDIYALNWTDYGGITDSSFVITALDPCTEYEWQVRARCSGGIWSDWTAVQEIRTKGCNPTYCFSYGLGQAAYINSTSIAGISFVSGNDYGYGGYTGREYRLIEGQALAISARATPPAGFGNDEALYWRYWIDRNQDGDFQDDQEMVAEGITVGTHDFAPASISGLVASAKAYRIRIGVSPERFPQVCAVESNKYIEDYAIFIDMAQQGIKVGTKNPSQQPIPEPAPIRPGKQITDASRLVIGTPYPNPVRSEVRLPVDLDQAGTLHWQMVDSRGNTWKQGSQFMDVGQAQLRLSLDDLPPGLYRWVIRTEGGHRVVPVLKH